MTRRYLPYLAVALLSGCFGGDAARPNGTPTFVISDGNHTQPFNDPNGNPDFFFLPPLVPNPVGTPNYDANDFNPNLVPTVEACALALGPSATEADVTLTTPCAPGGYFTSFGAPVNNGLQQYQGAWTVPVSDTLFYRVTVKVGTIVLGFMDVHTVSNPSLLHTVNDAQFVGQQDGSSLPIKFRVEIGALCIPAGTRPCNSATLADATGGTVNISTDGGSSLSGVHVPGGQNQGQHTLSVQTCADLNPRVVDLPTFGSCVHVSATPAYGSPLSSPATVEVCDVAGDIVSSGLSEAQEHRVTLHRLDGSEVRALPHVSGCAIVTGQVTPSFRSVLRDLASGKLGAAAGKLASLVGPAPLNARRRLDVGGGGATEEFSDFQFALPAKMQVFAGNGQTGGVNNTLPNEAQVKVTDLAGDPVANATVSFSAGSGSGSITPASYTTAADGIAKATWTLGAPLGSQGITASGRGIAGDDFNGPRTGVDPFMAIQPAFNPTNETVPSPLQAVLLKTGSIAFGANGIIPFGSGGYSYKQIASNATAPTNWQLPTFNETANGFTAGGTAPFASSGTPCNYAPGAAWTRNTDILVRKSFTLPAGPPRNIQVRVAVDRYAKQVYLNGTLLNATSLSWNGCAVPGAASDFILTGTGLGVGGTNLLTIRGSARSQSAFLDVRVAVVP